MIISVWGSNASGKTTFATKLGVTLDSVKKKTLIIYTENLSVDIASIYPYEKNFISMGDLWQTDLGEDDIYKLMHTVNGTDNLAYLSYAPKENIFSYPVYAKYNVVKVIMQLSDMFDFLIFDCSSDISSNVISMTALEMSDTVFRMCSGTFKSNCFFDSNLPLLSDSRFNVDSHINILSSARDYEALSLYKAKYSISYDLAFDELIHKQFIEGELNKINKSKYQSTLNNIINKEILLQKKLNVKEKFKKGTKPKKRFKLFEKNPKENEVFDDE